MMKTMEVGGKAILDVTYHIEEGQEQTVTCPGFPPEVIIDEATLTGTEDVVRLTEATFKQVLVLLRNHHEL